MNQNEGVRIEGPGANDNIVENNTVTNSGIAGIGLHGYVCSANRGDEVEDPNTGSIVRGNRVSGGERDGTGGVSNGSSPRWRRSQPRPARSSSVKRLRQDHRATHGPDQTKWGAETSSRSAERQSQHRRWPNLHLASTTKALYGASCSWTVSVCATRT
jgi:hypothetical protein